MLIDILAFLLAAATPAPAPAATPAAASSQAAFNAASEALDAGNYQEAVNGFAAIRERPAVRRSPIAYGTLLMRMGRGLTVLNRDDEAEKALREGLALVPSDHPELRNDRFLAEQTLGSIALRRFDNAGATEHFKASLALADEPAARSRALISLARATMFDPGTEALSYIDQAIGIAGTPAKPTKEERASLAVMQTVRARVLLNQGRFVEAHDTLKKAVAFQGGLDLSVSINEVITRSDLAIAALLAGREEDARKYLAYTGAGRLEKSPFDTAVAMQPPPCGGAANLQPEDVAVVEFAIQPDGTVLSPMPIYSSAKGPAASEFARAVADWSWKPEDAARIPEFFRLVTRVELRCSTSSERPAADTLLVDILNQWLIGAGAKAPAASGVPAADLVRLKAELAERRRSGPSIQLIQLLLGLGGNPAAPMDERIAWMTEARDVAIADRAPLGPQIMVEIRLAEIRAADRGYSANYFRTGLRALLARPGVSDDPIVAGTLKLLTSDPRWRSRSPADASAMLGEIAGDPRLDSRHPLKIGALIRLAALQAEGGDRVAAAESFRKTGVSAQQCALLDAKPALLHTNAGSEDFPKEAMRWGFEGWVRTEYDITADGRTASQRAIVAYPPFVFRKAAVDLVRGLRYSRSYRPDDTAGCGGAQENVRFSIFGRR